MRRLAIGLRGLIASLPEQTPVEAAVRHSYPDWVAETLIHDRGVDAGLALLRAGNEPAETIVRLVRGEIEGEETDVPAPTAWRRSIPTRSPRGIWPQSRASILAGLAVGRS